MERDEQIETLRDNEHLEQLEPDELEELIDTADARTLVSGEPLWSVGDDGDGAYALLSGSVELTWRSQPDGKQQERIDRPGSLIALAHLAGEWTHESTAYPVERTEVLHLSRSRFQDLFDRQHPAAYRLTDAIADRLVAEVRDANRRLAEVFGHPAETLRTLRRRAHDSERH